MCRIANYDDDNAGGNAEAWDQGRSHENNKENERLLPIAYRSLSDARENYLRSVENKSSRKEMFLCKIKIISFRVSIAIRTLETYFLIVKNFVTLSCKYYIILALLLEKTFDCPFIFFLSSLDGRDMQFLVLSGITLMHERS